VQKYKSELKVKEQDRKLKQEESNMKELEENSNVKKMADRWSNIHKRKLEEVDITKSYAREQFYKWVKSAAIQQLVNKKYRKGLYIKYEQCLKIGQKTSGVT
jgi:hypothetical protein